MAETGLSLSQEDQEKLKFFVQKAVGCFARDASRYIAVSLREEKAKSVNEKYLKIYNSFVELSATAGAAALGVPGNAAKGPAKALTSLTTYPVNFIMQKKDRALCKKMHEKYFTLVSLDRLRDILISFFFELFANYNVQFLHLLNGVTRSVNCLCKTWPKVIYLQILLTIFCYLVLHDFPGIYSD